jgi:hypothetical protein
MVVWSLASREGGATDVVALNGSRPKKRKSEWAYKLDFPCVTGTVLILGFYRLQRFRLPFEINLFLRDRSSLSLCSAFVGQQLQPLVAVSRIGE